MKTKKTIENIVYECVGEASMCWSQTPKGIFDTKAADKVAKKLLKAISKQQPAIEQAVKTLTDALKSDQSFYDSYKANIAMPFKDGCYNFKKKAAKRLLSAQDIHVIANKAADQFIANLCHEVNP